MVLISRLRPGQQGRIRGRVIRITDNDEFILSDRSGFIRVDANLDDDRRLQITRGDRLIVTGRRDGDDMEFDAVRIRTSEGDRVLSTPSFGDDDWFDRDRLDDDDLMIGSNTRNRLVGTDDDDVLIGKGGNDVLTGGRDRDLFVFERVSDGRDRITDFSPREDAIDMRAMFNQPNYRSRNPLDDYLELRQFGAHTQVRIDPDGDLGNRPFQTLVILENTSSSNISTKNILT